MSSPWEMVQRLLGEESLALDQRRWDDWLALYTKECRYWIPAWRSDGTLVEDPKTELSLVYYENRAGLEARVHRVRGGRSSASLPAARTTHLVQLVRLEDHGDHGDTAAPWNARTSWSVASVQEGRVATHFGYAEYVLERSGPTLRIRGKTTVIMNDVIHEVADFYNV